ncbi:hypothetical protein CEXT_38691 [Caerostris extrusa]|uniref:C2H2-type domain-containing protein n=1 Tax=Caerostris extrusa TaxID=172846 RepID=A0AAV4XXW8_CAEEX|nr:hypothetical protein CEXT_38691 [Caerostris extrusa]
MKPKASFTFIPPPQTALPSLVQVSLNSSPQYRLGSLTRFVRNGSNTTGRRKEKCSYLGSFTERDLPAQVGYAAPCKEIHRGEVKPHQCQQCLKSFSSNHQLTQHIRIHTGEKPYKCSYCDRRFKQLSHVQQHTRLHTEINRPSIRLAMGHLLISKFMADGRFGQLTFYLVVLFHSK